MDVGKPWTIREKILKELFGFGMRPNQTKPNVVIQKADKGGCNVTVKDGCELIDTDVETIQTIATKEYRLINCNIHIKQSITIDDLIDVLEGNRKYIPVLYVMNKVDTISPQELDLLHEDPNSVPIAANEKWCLEYLVERIWRRMNMVRVFTKPRGQIPDWTEPVILPYKKRTVEFFCKKIHKTLLESFKHGLVWGASAKHSPQTVGLQHVLEDGDVLEIVKKVG